MNRSVASIASVSKKQPNGCFAAPWKIRRRPASLGSFGIWNVSRLGVPVLGNEIVGGRYRDPVVHTSTEDGDRPVWASPGMGPGDVFEVTFDSPGRFTFHCIPHPFMVGEIVVVAAGR